MANISVSLPSDGQTADVADYNTPINTIVNEFNGNIDNSNIKSGAAIDGSKLASGGVGTTQLADGSVTFAKTSGIWWEELGRTTLGSAGDTISLTGLTAKKYLLIQILLLPTGGTINANVRFNNDSGSNYSNRSSLNGAADGTAVSQTSNYIDTGAAAALPIFATMNIMNITAQEKYSIASVISSSAGAGNAPNRREYSQKWANTANQITRIDLTNGGTGDYAIGSEVIVLGHD